MERQYKKQPAREKSEKSELENKHFFCPLT